ncbi:ABC transporter ATP-binding protein [Neobittarella massiliensis]|uniref:ABC transporter ATP-binding protein n=1 Tax=Neobittarella massiliensis (ex Bilen et al. 2018) TaxID=2041842 RepID=UPI000CF72893|nr:ABC transporter ATP-binding protein [Neobittarella massiliensis]
MDRQLLEVRQVTKYFGSGSVVTKALDGISLSVQRGDFTAIMGASGSGKSTLLNVIATIEQPSSGDIWVAGQNIAEMRERQLADFRRDQLGFVFQEYNLLDTLKVGENITLPLELRRTGRAEMRRELRRVAQTLGIQDQLDKYPRELSGGQRQRVACARALIAGPALILADEPTGALDSANSRGLMQTFVQMNEQLDSTILMVTHDAVVGSYARRVLFLKDGRIWSEVDRGSRDRRDMYREILAVMAALGGERDVW